MKSLKLASLALAFCGVAQADVKLPALFCDHMVLQRDHADAVWGWADPGEAIQAKLGDGAPIKATADANGKWRIDLPVGPASDTATTLTFTGKNTIELHDVLIGDVWICAGQSNMGFPLNGITNAAQVMKDCRDDSLRLFVVGEKLSYERLPDCTGKWAASAPGSAGQFTAVGYLMGRQLRHDLKIPIGLIETSEGGTSAQAWTSRNALAAQPALAPILAQFDADMPRLRAANENWEKHVVPDGEAALAIWRRDTEPSWMAALSDWRKQCAAAEAAGRPLPPRPEPNKPKPNIPAPPNRLAPTLLYNAMLAPLLPYSIKGVAWYQGEHNTFDPVLYRTIFPTMIGDWRARFGQGDFPFVFVQISRWKVPKVGPGLNHWAATREAQLLTLQNTPNTAMAVSIDVGDPNDVHYHNKMPVAYRVALAAEHLAYGKDGEYSGPLFDKLKIEGDSARLTFTHTGAGLMVGIAPSADPKVPGNDLLATPAPDGAKVVGFEIAGADQKFVPADARIDGDTIVVASSDVPTPVAVRYGWADSPEVNLYNRDGLPASPFRTDDWGK